MAVRSGVVNIPLSRTIMHLPDSNTPDITQRYLYPLYAAVTPESVSVSVVTSEYMPLFDRSVKLLLSAGAHCHWYFRLMPAAATLNDALPPDAKLLFAGCIVITGTLGSSVIPPGRFGSISTIPPGTKVINGPREIAAVSPAATVTLILSTQGSLPLWRSCFGALWKFAALIIAQRCVVLQFRSVLSLLP